MQSSDDYNHFTDNQNESVELIDNICDYYQADLRPHQIQALEFMNERSNGIIQNFCGTGKSKIIKEKAMSIDSGNVLIVFPSLALVQQFFDQYMDSNEDESIGVTICDSKHTKTINDQHFDNDLNIHLTTYASLAKYKKYLDYFDLVMFDEAHHIATSKVISIIQQIEDADIFYFTATPRIAKKLLNMYESEDLEESKEESKSVIQPLNPINCGEIFRYDFCDALADGYIVDYELHHCIYQPNKDINTDQFNVLVEFAQVHKRTRIIAFNQYVDKQKDNKTSSASFATFESDQIQLRIVSAKTNPKQREEIFKWFQQDDYEVTKILFNSQCIKEGIDLPCADLVVFCDDKQSPISIIQCIGRATRLSKNKQTAIILCISELSNESTEFKKVFNICKALKNIDFRLKYMFDNNKLENFIKTTIIGETQSNSMQFKLFKDKLIVEIGLRFGDSHWILKYNELKNFLDSNNNQYPNPRIISQKVIGLWVQVQKRNKRVNILSIYRIQQLELLTNWKWDHGLFDQWMSQYNELTEFLKKNNTYPTKLNRALSEWIRNQRRRKRDRKSGIMDEQRISLLEKLPDWKWEIDLEDNWIERFKHLQQYLSQHKNEYPMPSQGYEQKKLHRWISSNKRSKLGNGTYKVSEERIKLLETLPNWKWQENPDQEWLDKYTKLAQFVQQFNNYPSSSSRQQEEHDLGVWAVRQRTAKRGNSNGLMNEYRIKMLEKLPNWRWAFDNAPKWIDHYNILKAFVTSNNRYPKDNVPTEKQISVWVQVQKRNKKRELSCITLERIQMLELLPNWKWECDDFEGWMVKYNQIKKFIEINKRLPTSQTQSDEKTLSSWKNKQISKYNGKLTTNLQNIQIELLECLNGWKWSKNDIPKQYSQSVIKETHQRAFTSNITTLYDRYHKSQKELVDYHEQREKKQTLKPQESLPHNIITNKLKDIKNKSKVQVIDLGCGLNKIAENLKDDQRFEFTSIDFQRLPDSYGQVIEGNIAELGQFEECTFRYAIMSLCFWGLDFDRSIKECYRILEEGGVLYIIQTIKKMTGFEQVLTEAGFIKKCEQLMGKYYYLEYRK